ncbi:hypothetical protein FRB90_005334 [Tulasnella sp. 427]|nr:hypothetical protein FRB90_005334 [Tulasnella sp. 427]
MPPLRGSPLAIIPTIILGVVLMKNAISPEDKIDDSKGTSSAPPSTHITTSPTKLTGLIPHEQLLVPTLADVVASDSLGDGHGSVTITSRHSNIDYDSHHTNPTHTTSSSTHAHSSYGGSTTPDGDELDATQGRPDPSKTERRGLPTVITPRSLESFFIFFTDVANSQATILSPEGVRNHQERVVDAEGIREQVQRDVEQLSQTSSEATSPMFEWAAKVDWEDLLNSEDVVTTMCFGVLSGITYLLEVLSAYRRRKVSRKLKASLDYLLRKALIVKLEAKLESQEFERASLSIKAANDVEKEKSSKDQLLHRLDEANYSYENLRASFCDVLKEKLNLDDQVTQYKDDLACAGMREIEARALSDELENRITKYCVNIIRLSDALVDSQIETELYQERHQEAAQKARHANEQAERLDVQLFQARVEFDKQRKEINGVKEELKCALTELAGTKEDLDVAKRDLNDARSNAVSAQQEAKKQRKNCEMTERLLKAALAKLAEVKTQADVSEVDLDALKKQLKEERKAAYEDKKKAEEAFDALEASIKEQRELNDELSRRLAEQDATLAAVKATRLHLERSQGMRLQGPLTPALSSGSLGSAGSLSPSGSSFVDAPASTVDEAGDTEKARDTRIGVESPRNIPLPDSPSFDVQATVTPRRRVAFAIDQDIGRGSILTFANPDTQDQSKSLLALDLALPLPTYRNHFSSNRDFGGMTVLEDHCLAAPDDGVLGSDEADVVEEAGSSPGSDSGAENQAEVVPYTPSPPPTGRPRFTLEETPDSVIIRRILARAMANASASAGTAHHHQQQPQQLPQLPTEPAHVHAALQPVCPVPVRIIPRMAWDANIPDPSTDAVYQPPNGHHFRTTQHCAVNPGRDHLQHRSHLSLGDLPPSVPYQSVALSRTASYPLYQPWVPLTTGPSFPDWPAIVPRQTQSFVAPPNVNRQISFPAQVGPRDWTDISDDLERIRDAGVSPELRSPDLGREEAALSYVDLSLELSFELPDWLLGLNVSNISLDDN